MVCKQSLEEKGIKVLKYFSRVKKEAHSTTVKSVQISHILAAVP